MKHVLLIDDDASVRKMLRMSLEGLGYAVTEANDGIQGLAAFKKSPADLVITDLVMPEKEGLETIRDLRKAHPGLKIIAISGGSSSNARDNLKMAKNFGASAVISKPFSVGSLATTVATLLEDPLPDPTGPVFEPE